MFERGIQMTPLSGFFLHERVQTTFLFETSVHVFISNKLETRRQLM